MARIARLVSILLAAACTVAAGLMGAGALAAHQPSSDQGGPPAADPVAEASVRCLPFGFCGESLAETLVANFNGSSGDLILQGTSIGLYVLGLDGSLRHFLYTPFGTRFVALIDDITGDGNGEVVLALGSTQVPALRCYDGATWEKLWQYAPMVKVWDDRHWVERQTPITSLTVMPNEGSPGLAMISDGRVLAVDARDGNERWRSGTTRSASSLEALGDLDGDGTDEVFVSGTDGRLFLLDGRTGGARWHTRLPEQRSDGEVTQIAPGDALVLDAEEGLVAVAATDGLVRLYDLRNNSLEWDVSLSGEDTGSVGPMVLVPNATAGGRPGILASYDDPVPLGDGSFEVRQRMALLDAAGNWLWDRDGGNSWSLNVGSFGGRPVLIQPAEEEIRLIDLADGHSVVRTIATGALQAGAWNVRQIGTDAFLVGSEMTALSSTGDVLWHYPLIDNVRATSGDFVGDATEDTLFSGEWERESWNRGPGVNEDGITLATPPYTTPVEAPEPEVRLLKVMDGATGEIAWSYEVPPGDMKDGGGLKGVEVAADLVGNDAQDIVGYRADSVCIFDGSSGALASFPTSQPVESLQVMRSGGPGRAFAVVAADNLTIFDCTGAALWTTTGAEWVDGETVRFTALDDVNSDNVGDLAVLCESRIVLLESAGSAAAYQPHLTFEAEAGCLIEFAQVVPDANGDGVRELAYIQRDPGTADQEWDKTPAQPSEPLLVKRSPVGGEQLLRITIPGWSSAVELSSGDFDGDGCPDALICCDSYQIYGDPGSPGEYGAVLRAVSGRDGLTLWEHLLTNKSSWSVNGWKSSLPAGSAGDVTGDGKDDLGWTSYSSVEAYSGYYCVQQCVEVYDAAHDRPVATVPVSPLLGEDAGGYGGVEYPLLFPGDANGDGRADVLAGVSEPTTAPLIMSPYVTHVAVLDLQTGERLAAYLGFSPLSVSLFETHRPGVVGLAGAGGAYFLNTGLTLQITSPAHGASTGPTVDVRWEGTGQGEFVQVFVDGVRNHTGNKSGVRLYLGRGDHDIVVWSIDDHGRILYGPANLGAPISIRVTASPWKPVMLVLTLLAAATMVLAMAWPRQHRLVRAQRRTAVLRTRRQ